MAQQAMPYRIGVIAEPVRVDGDLSVAFVDRLEIDASARSCRGRRYDSRCQAHRNQVEDDRW
jgi:hypothetical protein